MEAVLNIVGLAVIAIVWVRAERRASEVRDSAGAELYRVHRPLSRAPAAWMIVFGHGSMVWLNADRLPESTGVQFVVRLLAVVLFSISIARLFYLLWKGGIFVDAILGEKGVLLSPSGEGTDAMIPWSAVKRWTWNRTPALQLNLHDGHTIRTIPVPESSQNDVERLLEKLVGK